MNKKEFSCVLCGGDLETVFTEMWDDRFGTPGRYEIDRCLDCQTEQTVPRLPADVLGAFYEKYYNFSKATGKASSPQKKNRYARLRKAFYQSSIYRLWLILDGDISFHSASASKEIIEPRLLDVGCNEGRGLVRFHRSGFDAEGLELNRIAAQEAQSLGFAVHTVPIAQLYPEKKFDVVVLSNVLEHTLDPHDMLQNVRRILTNDGEMWISVPNGSSIFRWLFGRRWINWHVPYHIFHFTAETLKKFIEEEKFTIESVRCETPALWVAQPMITILFARPDVPTIKLRSYLLVGALTLCTRAFLFPLLWIANRTGRGDCLMVRARRIH